MALCCCWGSKEGWGMKWGGGRTSSRHRSPGRARDSALALLGGSEPVGWGQRNSFRQRGIETSDGGARSAVEG